MNKSIVVTRPHYDLVTNYFYSWSQSVLDMAVGKNLSVQILDGDKATRKNFESYLQKHKPDFIFLNGHGDASVVTGHNNEPLLDKHSNFKTCIIYARSCEAAFLLGSQLIKKTTLAFIGYKRKFIFGYAPDKITKPLDDSLAKMFLEPSNLVPSTIIKGHTAKEAHFRSKAAMYKNFRKMISSAASYEERYAARWLWSNINCQTVLGDQNAKI